MYNFSDSLTELEKGYTTTGLRNDVYLKQHRDARGVKQRILHACSCIIEFIKFVGETDKMRDFAEHLIGFPQRV